MNVTNDNTNDRKFQSDTDYESCDTDFEEDFQFFLKTVPCISDEFINEYIDNKKPFDKAGSYGIQDGYDLVKSLNGSFDNVVGLPSEKIGEILKEIFTK